MTLHADENEEKLNHSYITVGNVKWFSCSGNSLIVSLCMTVSTWWYHTTQKLHCWVFIWEKWRLLFTQKRVSNVYSSSIHNLPTLETIQMSFTVWMAKQTVVHSYQGKLFSPKGTNYWYMNNLYKSLDNYAERKKEIPKG